jgi:hypothetical protein
LQLPIGLAGIDDLSRTVPSILQSVCPARHEQRSSGIQDYRFSARTVFFAGQEGFNYCGICFAIASSEIGQFGRLQGKAL